MKLNIVCFTSSVSAFLSVTQTLLNVIFHIVKTLVDWFVDMFLKVLRVLT